MPATRQCVGQNTDELMRQSGAPATDATCSQPDWRCESERIATKSACRFGNTTTTTRTVFTGDFQTPCRGEIQSRYDPPLAGALRTRPEAG